MKTSNTSLIGFLQLIIRAAGSKAPEMKKSIGLTIVTAVLRGLMFLLFVPLFEAILNKDATQSLTYLGVLTLLWGLSSVSDWLCRDYDFGGHSGQATDEIRRMLGAHLRTMPLQELYAKRTGEINADLAGNVDLAITYSMMVSNMLLTVVITPTVVGLGALFFDWRLGLALLLVFPAVVPVFLWAQPKISARKAAFIKASNDLSSETIEYVQGLPVLKSSNCIGDKAQRFSDANNTFKDLQSEAAQAEAPLNVLIASIIEIGMALVVGLGLWLVSNGDISLMILAGIMVATIRFAEPLTSFMSLMSILVLMQSIFKRLDSILTIKPLVQLSPVQTPTAFDIVFDHVSFSYQNSNEDELALDNINATIQGNGLTALVGTSGCGKTSLVRMIMRYADPQSGTISIGGVNIKNIAPETLSSLVAVVFQDVYLFDESVFANIKMGNIHATDEQVYAAARAAYCHEFITRLPEGYQTKVGDIGGNLSGGEKQRISIARALLKDAPIVVLDEPTAALDTESEVAVQRAIDVLVKNKTVIVIAHRLSTIIAANQILVMDKGKIAERGTHAELLEAQGRYQHLWQAAHTEIVL